VADRDRRRRTDFPDPPVVISLLVDWDMPPIVRQALHFVPAAVLTAIVFPELLLRNGGLALSADNYRLIAGVVAIRAGLESEKNNADHCSRHGDAMVTAISANLI